MPNVFLDNDGVLAAFDEHCEALFGAGPRGLVYDCPDRGPLKGDAALWAHVGTRHDFWETIPVKEGAFDLVRAALPHSPSILTGCPRDGYDLAAAHKVQWVRKMIAEPLGVKIPVITCLSRDKPLHLKAPGDILVDDFIVNIKRWQKAGGTTVWYQNPADGLESFKRKLERAERRGE